MDDLETLIREGRLDEIGGVGSGEFVHTVCKLLHELLKEKQ